MGLGFRRGRAPCFCNLGCPAGTFPFEQYWVLAPAPTEPQYGLHAYLYRFDHASPNGCTWFSVANHLQSPETEQLLKVSDGADPNVNDYTLELLLADPRGINVWSQRYDTPLPEEGELVQPEANANSCSRTVILLPHNILGATWTAQLIPAYPDACDDSDFPEKAQKKLLAPF